MTKLLSVDGFRAAAKDGARPDGAVMRATASAPETVGERKKRFIFSDGTVDRMGDSIDPAGWELGEFGKNSVALWCHDSSSPPIGRASSVGVIKKKLIGDIEFMTAEISPFADSIYRMVDGGFLNAVSVGFIPLEYDFSQDKDRPWGVNFKRQSLLEISCCAVPANPNALQEARAAGIDTDLLRGWAEKLLDLGDGRILVPRDFLEEIFRQAKTPRTVRQKYLAKADASDWQVGASRDLPVDDAESWDGPAAAKRMLDAAGFDGDSPDATKAKRGFLIHDAANPTLRGSYKLPFADISDGALKAMKGGIAAASSRLPQTDAPQSVIEDAKGVIDHYETKAGMGDAARALITSGVMSPDAGAKAIGDDDAPTGSCGRSKDQECGMTDPAECAIHAPTSEAKTIAEVAKAGRRVSGATAALLHEAMDHHASASACLQKVLDSNAPADPDDDNDNDLEIPLTDEERRQKRLKDAQALIASLKS